MLRDAVLALILALGICLSPLTADTQQAAKVSQVGFLRTFPVPEMEKAFRQGLQELGYVEGQNIVIEQRYWNGNTDRRAEVVAELLRLKVDVIVAPTPPEIEAARRGTTTTPIVHPLTACASWSLPRSTGCQRASMSGCSWRPAA